MNTKEIFKFLQEEIHSTIFATTDEDNLPVTSVIDIMLAKDDKLYFLTAKGKSFYDRLIANHYVAFSGLVGEDTMSSQSVSCRAHVRDIGPELLEEIFENNTYMNDIYPSAASRKALTVFEIYKGSGEYFDLSKKPIERYGFTFGGESKLKSHGYSISDDCTMCGSCLISCPTNCIEEGNPFKIHEENCLHCGNCFESCEFGAVIKD